MLTLVDGKAQNTSWQYDQFGRVTNKIDNLGTNLFVYAYDADNRLTSRTSAAKAQTSYSYDKVGNLTFIDYPVSPDITLQYDAVNRLTNMVDAVGTTRYAYDAVGQILSEDGPWDNDTVSYTYANRLRTGLSVAAPNASPWTQTYAYDELDRMTNVTSPAGSFGYYFGSDPSTGITDPGTLVRKLSLPNGAYITNSYDSVARMTGTYLRNSEDTNLDVEEYVYNVGGQRTQQVFTAGNYMNYTYDSIGELKTALGDEPGGTTNRMQEQFGYFYDAAGNLNYRTNNALIQTYTVNSLNELTQVHSDGTLTVAGTTTSPATNVIVITSNTVAVLTNNATLYVDNTFSCTNQPVGINTNLFIAIARDSYGRKDTNVDFLPLALNDNKDYDLNGNLLRDKSPGGGTNKVFVYDDENQMAAVWVTNFWKSEFTYDGKMRRRVRKEYSWNGSSWLQTNEVRYVYDGNLVIQERDVNDFPQVTYTRGRDLNGKFESAGGIGGLLARTSNPQLLASDSFATAFYHADGNGNISALIFSNQLLAAKYEYDPYGNTLSKIGVLADNNLYRFSGKEVHPLSGLIYYLYRYYDANLQRWINRDPLGEEGGANLYGFVENNPINDTDAFGLLAGAPLPLPPTLPPPVLTPKPGPPVVMLCTVEFCCVYAGIAYVCDKTGFHDWLGDKICKWRNNDREKCRKDCDDQHDRDSEDCRSRHGKAAQRKCLHDAFDRYSRCLADCNK